MSDLQTRVLRVAPEPEGRERDRPRPGRARGPVAPRQLRQGAAGVRERRTRRAHAGLDLRRRRAGLHAGLRDPPADQLRPRRRVLAVGPRRQHDAPLGARADGRLEQPRGRRGDRRDPRRHDPALRGHQRDHRADRLSPAPACAAADAADHRGRDVVHRLEHLARALRRRLRERLRPDPAGRGVHDRRDPLHVEARLRARDHRPRPRRAQLVRRATRARGRRCARSPRTRRRRR